MKWRFSPTLTGATALVLLTLMLGCGGQERKIEASLLNHVLFFSNFEKGFDALSCAGPDLAVFETANPPRREDSGGKVDGYLSFAGDASTLSYGARENFPYNNSKAWSGAVSFWLSVDPSRDLEANYPEPFHIGKKQDNAYPWDDAVLFVDFTKPPRALRFGCYPNKTREVSDEMVNQRVIRVENLNWKSDEWHHIVITWKNFNSGAADAEWALFVDGVEKGRKSGLRQDITWNMADQVVRLNHYKYTGKIDEIAIFDKMLMPEEAQYLYNPRLPLNTLLKKDR